MRSRYKILNDKSLIFLTNTIIEWIPIFTDDKYYQIIINSLIYCQKEKQLKIYAYVIMDNHMHLIACGDDLPNIMKSFKRHTAKMIIETLVSENKHFIVDKLNLYKKRFKKQSAHQVWQEGYHPQEIFTDDALEQKINYIHNNPVKRGLIEKEELWKYSSAGHYLTGIKGEIELDEIF